MSPYPDCGRRLRPAPALSVLLALLLPCLPASAGDDIQAATAVWNEFVAALRQGDYPAAHRLFSAESRAAMPYADFVMEYSPVSAAREMVLAKPESLSARVDGEWAEIAFAGASPGGGRRFRVGVSLVRNQGRWGLVAARNEGPERLEAEARGVLSALSAWRGRPEAGALLDDLRRENAESRLFRAYRFEAEGGRFLAVPLAEGLRTFALDDRGGVRALVPPSRQAHWDIDIDAAENGGNALPPPPAAVSPAPEPGLPELREPPAPAFGPLPPLDEMAEPPSDSRPVFPARRPRSEVLTLPDSIE